MRLFSHIVGEFSHRLRAGGLPTLAKVRGGQVHGRGESGLAMEVKVELPD
jgi:hypothetical protein